MLKRKKKCWSWRIQQSYWKFTNSSHHFSFLTSCRAACFKLTLNPGKKPFLTLQHDFHIPTSNQTAHHPKLESGTVRGAFIQIAAFPFPSCVTLDMSSSFSEPHCAYLWNTDNKNIHPLNLHLTYISQESPMEGLLSPLFLWHRFKEDMLKTTSTLGTTKNKLILRSDPSLRGLLVWWEYSAGKRGDRKSVV